MRYTIDEIRQMALSGRYDELRALGESLCEGYSGDDLAWVYRVLSFAFGRTATTPAEYNLAVRYAELAIECATPGSAMRVFMLGRLASMAADSGQLKRAEIAGLAYEQGIATCPGALPIAPWAYFALARVYDRKRHYRKAQDYLQQAIEWCTDERFADNLRIYRVRFHIHAKRIGRAIAELPTEAKFGHEYELATTRALLYAKLADWRSAKAQGLFALQCLRWNPRPARDDSEYIELLLTLRQAAHHLGEYALECRYGLAAFRKALEYHSADAIAAILLPILEREGGEIDAEDSRHAAAGFKRGALVGALG